jgi:hypothetical protein
MVFTKINIISNLSILQKDIIVKTGFVIFGASYSKAVKNTDIHTIVALLARYNIPFTLQSIITNNISNPCYGCKK